MNTIICLTETPVWHQGYIKHHLRNPGINMTGMDEISYRCLYKNEPIEREGLLYTDEELRRFITLPITEPDAVWGICDTKNKGTDFLFLPCLLQYGNDFYLTECVCDDNSNYGIQYERTSDLIVNTGMQQCQFESNNGGDRVALEVSKLVEEKGGRCNITTKYTESNKETKIIVNADWVKKHVLFKDREQYKPKEDYGKSDIKGLTIQFGENYPTKFSAMTDDGTSVEFLNNSQVFKTDTVFSNTACSESGGDVIWLSL